MPLSHADAQVTVIGSVNRDLILDLPRLPRPGETVVGGDSVELVGGKGANQAVAAARLGARTELIGAVGTDGAELVQTLRAEGVEVARVQQLADVPSGVAVIFVDDDGENMIALSPGANASLRPADVPDRLAGVVLLQHEIGADVVARAVAVAAGATVILNPAPYRPIPAAVLAGVDVLVLNAGELAEWVGRSEAVSSPQQAAQVLASLTAEVDVVATLGAAGAVVRHDGAVMHLPAPSVPVVDTVGAGDAFCGALAVALSGSQSMIEAVRYAIAAGSLTVGAAGAQSAMPDAERVRALLRDTGARDPRTDPQPGRHQDRHQEPVQDPVY